MDCDEEHMLTFDALKSELEYHNLREVARQTDLHYNTVYRFMNTEKDPKYSTMKALSDYVEAGKKKGPPKDNPKQQKGLRLASEGMKSTKRKIKTMVTKSCVILLPQRNI